MKKQLILLLVLFGITTMSYADIALSGDARVRPRMDVKDNGEYGNKTIDNYYLYRARLNLKADIGEGWFLYTKLGTNSAAYWTGKFGTGAVPSELSLPSAGRGTLSFMELYFGLKRDNYGFMMGIIPVNGIANPALDLHFYPTIVVDIPWLIFNNNAAHGFNTYLKIGSGKLNATMLVENNVTQLIEYEDSESKRKDQYSLIMDYGFKFAGFSLDPWFLYTLAGDSVAAPMTYGANVTAPKIAGFTPAVSFFKTSQSVDETANYTGNLLRFKVSGKVGPGSLLLWYDAAKVEWDDADTHNYSYVWAHYKYVVYKSDKGEFSLKPTVRIESDSVQGVKDYSRTKIELTTEFKFK